MEYYVIYKYICIIIPKYLTKNLTLKYSTILSEKSIKIIIYIDSQGCTSCKIKELYDWNEFMSGVSQALPA